ncbi:MAG: DUF5819 family protein [Aeromicrobium sp.]
MPRLTLKTTFVVVASTVALLQLLAVTFASLPPNRYTDAAAPHTTYLSPMFAQNWRLFAPNPVSEDRTIEFQGSYRDADGTIKQTEWVDWTGVELDLIHHRLIGGRAGYVTNKLFSPLGARYGALLPEQRVVADATTQEAPPSWEGLGKQLVTAGPKKPLAAATYLRYEQAAIRLATGVLEARWPDRTFIAVHYSLNRQGVVPYESRNKSEAEREASRPAKSVRISGWRVPEQGTAAERRAIADFDRRHR